jgi:DNA helicase-2/ATP-dependent DNA helicase PcrA
MDDLIKGLNPKQRDAVTAGDGPVLVVAGPGSGKTRVLTHRIAYLTLDRGILPRQIMAVTFTNKAAAEMRERVERLRGGHLDGLSIGTFHAICARLLRMEADFTPYTRDFLIYDTDDQQSLMKRILQELNLNDRQFSAGRVLGAISALKNELIAPEQHQPGDYFGEIVARVYPVYQKALRANNALDFDDLLMQTVLLLKNQQSVRERYQARYVHVLIDEFQDTNTAQYDLVRLIGAPQNNIFVVGDEDQGIYAFRGADYRNVLQFRRDYPQAQVVVLEQNYRSTQMILDAARAVIDKNQHRTPKALFTERSGGALVTIYQAHNDIEEGDFVAGQIARMRQREGLKWSDFAVMYRTNAQSQPMEAAFVRAGIPYRLIGGVGFYKRREVRDLMAYLRLIHNPNDSVSFGRVVNVPGRGIGAKSLEQFSAWLSRDQLTLAEGLAAIANGTAAFTLSGKAGKGLQDFAVLLRDVRALAELGNELTVLFDEIMAKTGYRMHLDKTSESTEELNERQENINQLRAVLYSKRELALSDALEELALVAEADSVDTEEDRVTLLTLHAAKGLEFPIVFIGGIEDGLLPHSRSLDNAESMAEERRLMYVGLTRAKDQLILSYAFRRALYGEAIPSVPSRFLMDIPPSVVDNNPRALQEMHERDVYKRATAWDSPSQPDSVTTPRVPGKGGGSKVIPFPSGAAAGRGGSGGGRSAPSRYRVGMRVRSKKYGEGVIQGIEGAAGDELITVRFAGGVVKRLLASFGDLVILG